jgi:hypothetical protein
VAGLRHPAVFEVVSSDDCDDETLASTRRFRAIIQDPGAVPAARSDGRSWG